MRNMLIRPDRNNLEHFHPDCVDKKIELGFADKNMPADLFCVMFKHMEGDAALPKNAASNFREAAWSQKEEAEVERLAKEFAARVRELKFSPAGILSFLLEYRR